MDDLLTQGEVDALLGGMDWGGDLGSEDKVSMRFDIKKVENGYTVTISGKTYIFKERSEVEEFFVESLAEWSHK